MQRHHLRWWLWTCATFVALGIAGIFGFYSVLWQQDVTFLGFVVLAIYLASTAWLGWRLKAGSGDNGAFWFIAEQMERAGLLGSFVGLAIAFQAMRTMDAGGAWKQHLIEGISTKFLCSIVGLTGAMFLRTQLWILSKGNYDA